MTGPTDIITLNQRVSRKPMRPETESSSDKLYAKVGLIPYQQAYLCSTVEEMYRSFCGCSDTEAKHLLMFLAIVGQVTIVDKILQSHPGDMAYQKIAIMGYAAGGHFSAVDTMQESHPGNLALSCAAVQGYAMGGHQARINESWVNPQFHKPLLRGFAKVGNVDAVMKHLYTKAPAVEEDLIRLSARFKQFKLLQKLLGKYGLNSLFKPFPAYIKENSLTTNKRQTLWKYIQVVVETFIAEGDDNMAARMLNQGADLSLCLKAMQKAKRFDASHLDSLYHHLDDEHKTTLIDTLDRYYSHIEGVKPFLQQKTATVIMTCH